MLSFEIIYDRDLQTKDKFPGEFYTDLCYIGYVYEIHIGDTVSPLCIFSTKNEPTKASRILVFKVSAFRFPFIESFSPCNFFSIVN